MSSVTVACTVRSPSARLESSSRSLKIACWLRSLSRRCDSTACCCCTVVRRSLARPSHSVPSAASVAAPRSTGSQAPAGGAAAPDAMPIAPAATAASVSTAATATTTLRRSIPRAAARSAAGGIAPLGAGVESLMTVPFFLVSLNVGQSCGGLGEGGALENRAQREDRPVLLAAAKRAGEIALAARDRRRRIARELALREAPEAEHLIDEQPRGDLAMIDDEDARVARRGRHTAADELPQVDHGQQLTPYVREPANPGLRTRHASQRRRHGQHLARLLACREKELPGHAQRDADPFAPALAFLPGLCRDRASAPLELLQELEGPVAQRLERDPLHRLRGSARERRLGLRDELVRRDGLDHVVDGALAQAPDL